MRLLQRLASLFPDWPARFALAGFVTLIVPPLVVAPWVPFVDLVAFVGLNNFPPKLSAGPLHFSVFQFTYIVPHALSRLMFDLGLSRATQVLLLYLLQAGIFFGVTQFLLRRLIAAPAWCSAAIVAGVLAFWDGQFLWGGPLAFSLAAACIALATGVTFRDVTTEGGPPTRWAVGVLCVVAMMCHPFAFPFAVLVVALRGVFVPATRLPGAGLALLLVVFAWVIKRDSADSPDVHFTTLFGLPFTGFFTRCQWLWTADADLVTILFGDVPDGLRTYLFLIGTIHALGFLAAPIALVTARDNRPIRLLAAFNTAIALLYFCARVNPVISEWPQRMLSFHYPITFVAGVVLPAFLLRGRARWAQWRESRMSILAVGMSAVGLALIVAVQVPVLRFGREIERNYARLRGGLAATDFSNAFVVTAGVETIRPFYLRAVPFLLFSDAEVVKRNVIFFTEWHLQFRHPTRLVEHWFDLGRPRVQGTFVCREQTLGLNFTAPPAGTTPVTLGNNSNISNTPARLAELQLTLGTELLALGATRDAVLHFQTAAALVPDAPAAQNNLSVALLRAGRHAEALVHAEKAVALQPRSGIAHVNLAVLCIATGDRERAARELEAAIALEPRIADWHIELAATFAKLGRVADARREFEIALQLEPGNATARRELEQLPAR